LSLAKPALGAPPARSAWREPQLELARLTEPGQPIGGRPRPWLAPNQTNGLDLPLEQKGRRGPTL